MSPADVKNLLFGVVLGFGLIFGVYYLKASTSQFVTQPSVPSLIPPPPACPCPAKPTRPVNVVCPYCRNTLSVRPSATTGEAVGTLVPKAK